MKTMKNLLIWFLLMLPCGYGQEMHIMVRLKLEKVEKYLQKAEDSYGLSPSYDNKYKLRYMKLYMKEAEKHWQQMFDWNKNRIDKDHPKIKATKEHFDSIYKKMKQLGGTPTKENSAEKNVKSTFPGIKLIAYRLNQVTASLSKAESTLKNKSISARQHAQRYVKSAEKKINNIKKYYHGRFDSQHPDFLAVIARLEKLQARLKKMEMDAQRTEVILKKLLPVIADYQEKVKKAWSPANYAINSSELDVAKIKKCLAAMNRVLPKALGTIDGIYSQFPDKEALKESKIGYEVIGNCNYIKNISIKWWELLDNASNKHLREIKQFFSSANDSKNLAIKEQNPMAKEVRISQINTYADWIDRRLDIILLFYPKNYKLTKKQQGFLDRVNAHRRDSLQLRKTAAQLGNIVVSERKLRLQRARIPQTNYTGKKWRVVENNIYKICQLQFPGDKIKRVVIKSGWQERSEARWRHHRWIYGTYLYIEAWVCKEKNGKMIVYDMTFRRTKQKNSDWSALEYWSVGHSYEILPENINK